jgi:hemolysin activation/secretion protein
MKKNKCVGRLILITVLCALANCWAKEKPPVQFEEKREADTTALRERSEKAWSQIVKQSDIEIAKAKLPKDDSVKIMVKEITFSGNTLVTTKKIIANMPVIFNTSNKPLKEASGEYLYDFTAVREILATPGTPRGVTARTIQGLTQYVLSIYQNKNYGGIYVYVPAETLKGEELKDGILRIDIIEAHVSNVGMKYYDADQNAVPKGYLDSNAMLGWSPVKEGKVINKKKLDDFVNLLNLNPDRYVTATVSKGDEPNTLAVNYGIYEASPWHFFAQVDNSGVKGREWNPKVGIINTNLLGRDDSFFAMYQVPWDSDWQDNYSLFGSYDFPLTGPELRLNIYGGYSAFNLSPHDSDLDFIGGGKFIGANLKYNVLQYRGWFFDVTGNISEEQSDITPFFGSTGINEAASNVRMTLLGYALDLYKRDDISNTSFGYKFTENTGGSGREEFNKSRPPVPGRVDKYFTIHTLSAAHSRILDVNRITRISSTFRWIMTEDRLPPAKMTPFGGMYSVRGYKEYELIADEGILASAQYEFDLVRYEKLKRASRADVDNEQRKEKGLKKLSPLTFIDYGHSKTNGLSGQENKTENLLSVGIGMLGEYGDNFSSAVYYGIPLRATEDTKAGSGRVNVTFMLRW